MKIKVLLTIFLLNIFSTNLIKSATIESNTIKDFFDTLHKIEKKIKSEVDRTIDHVDKWQMPHSSLPYNKVTWLAAHNAFSSIKEGYFPYFQQVYGLDKMLYKLGVRTLLIDLHPTTTTNKTNVKSRLCHGPCSINPILRLGELYKNFKKHYEKTWWWPVLEQAITKNKKIEVIALLALVSDEIKGKDIYKIYQNTKTRSSESYLKEVKSFLDKNPSEIITLVLENYCDEKTTENIIDKELKDIVLKPSDWNPVKQNGWPTIGWMISYNKRIVIFDGSLKKDTKYCFAQWNYMKENQYGTTDINPALKERDESKNQKQQVRYLNSINLFPGSELENIKPLANSFGKNLKNKNLVDAAKNINGIIKIVEDYWNLNYKNINSTKIEKLLNNIKQKGLNTGTMKGETINFINLDMVHKGNPFRYINKMNELQRKSILKNKDD